MIQQTSLWLLNGMDENSEWHSNGLMIHSPYILYASCTMKETNDDFWLFLASIVLLCVMCIVIVMHNVILHIDNLTFSSQSSHSAGKLNIIRYKVEWKDGKYVNSGLKAAMARTCNSQPKQNRSSIILRLDSTILQQISWRKLWMEATAMSKSIYRSTLFKKHSNRIRA